MKRGLRPLPDPIRDAPRLHPGLELYYTAFKELSTCRAIGMAAGPIPWTAMETYADKLGLTGDDFERFTVLVRMLDSEYLEYQLKRTKE